MRGGASHRIRFPSEGPYDKRLGYTRIPEMVDRLESKGFKVFRQAHLSSLHAKAIDWGIFPIYNPKGYAGLRILDRNGEVLFGNNYPERVYASFEDIPRIVVDTLAFIEDRSILTNDYPRHNPAVEWDRFAGAVSDYLLSRFDRSRKVQGGSTLATQLEKFRHSAEGRTHSAVDKMRQMLSAAIRAYKGGSKNLKARQDIVLDYINSVPLAALPKYGEVNGVGDGLWAYFGANFEEFNQVLKSEKSEDDLQILRSRAEAYIQVLSLFLAHRRPSYYLNRNTNQLAVQVARYLPILREEGIISDKLFQAAQQVVVSVNRKRPEIDAVSFLGRKGANAVRTSLLSKVGVEKLYQLDRLDLDINSTLDNPTQQAVTEVLLKLKDPKFIKKQGLDGFRLLDKRGDLENVIYSFTLYEKGEKENLLRVQTDNLDQPFDINRGVKLDLGSTAKLRTLITYLEIVESLHKEFHLADTKTIAKAQKIYTDPLSRWALNYLAKANHKGRLNMLQAAMAREYSASPHERFFTGGGIHTFNNFSSKHNGGRYPIKTAFRYSINLPFVRLMRDIVSHYSLRVSGSTARTLAQMKDSSRKEYLSRFADKEGKHFLYRFYKKYRSKSPEDILKTLLDGVPNTPKRYAAVYLSINPLSSREEFSDFLRNRFERKKFSESTLESLYILFKKTSPSLADKGYVARVHPLELWVAGYLYRYPHTNYAQAVAASADDRQEVYSWLLDSKRRRAQNQRIKTMIEVGGFFGNPSSLGKARISS